MAASSVMVKRVCAVRSLWRSRARASSSGSALNQIRQHSFQGVKLAESYKPSNVGDVCLVVRKGDTETLARLNKAIATIKADGTLAQIVKKWGI